MPEISVKALLQREVIAALKSKSHVFNTSDGRDGVYPSERLDLVDGLDPANAPCAFVFMPELESTSSLSSEIVRAQMSCKIYLYFPEIDRVQADASSSDLVSEVVSALSNNSYTPNMRKIGGYHNAATVNEIGWVERGQDLCFAVTASYGLTFNKSGVVSVP